MTGTTTPESSAKQELAAGAIEAMCRGIYGPTWDGPPNKEPGAEMKQVWRTYARELFDRQPVIVRKAILGLNEGAEGTRDAPAREDALMWPFTRKPSLTIGEQYVQLCERERIMGIKQFSNPLLARWDQVEIGGMINVSGEVTVVPLFDRDDLHATIVQTLIQNAGLPTYELADQIVDAISGGLAVMTFQTAIATFNIAFLLFLIAKHGFGLL